MDVVKLQVIRQFEQILLHVRNVNVNYYSARRRISITIIKLKGAVISVVMSRISEMPVVSKDHVASIFRLGMEAIYSSEKLALQGVSNQESALCTVNVVGTFNMGGGELSL
jgi:hypothetical protein